MQTPSTACSLDRPARGRPREFDPNLALADALRVFVALGYAGASVAELTKAMGINSPSLYQCYGSKEELFKQALGLYAQKHLSYLVRLLDGSNIDDVVAKLIQDALGPVLPCEARGFLGLLASLSAGINDQGARQAVAAHQEHVIDALAARFERAQSDGALPKAADPKTLAYFLEALLHGIHVQARNGVDCHNHDELTRISLEAFDFHARRHGPRHEADERLMVPA